MSSFSIDSGVTVTLQLRATVDMVDGVLHVVDAHIAGPDWGAMSLNRLPIEARAIAYRRILEDARAHLADRAAGPWAEAANGAAL